MTKQTREIHLKRIDEIKTEVQKEKHKNNLFGSFLLASRDGHRIWSSMDIFNIFVPDDTNFQNVMKGLIKELLEQGYTHFYVCNPEYAYYSAIRDVDRGIDFEWITSEEAPTR